MCDEAVRTSALRSCGCVRITVSDEQWMCWGDSSTLAIELDGGWDLCVKARHLKSSQESFSCTDHLTSDNRLFLQTKLGMSRCDVMLVGDENEISHHRRRPLLNASNVPIAYARDHVCPAADHRRDDGGCVEAEPYGC